MHKFCIWSLVIMGVLFMTGCVLGNLFPPPSPQQDAETVARYYAEHTLELRIGFIIGASGGIFLAPFTAALAWEIKRMTGPKSLAAYVQIVLGTIMTLTFFFPWAFFMATSFRPERSAEATQSMNDTSWMFFLVQVTNILLQFLFLGYAILNDRRATPTFPRWAGYYCLFAALDLMGTGFVVLFKTGPFAWNGILAYYMPMCVFGGWVAIMVRYLLRAADAEHAGGPSVTDGLDVDSRIDSLTTEITSMRAELAHAVDADAPLRR